MALLAQARPRFKPMLTQQETLREPPPEIVDSSGLTPQQIAARRKMAQEMSSAGSDYSPVQHWTQGLARVAQALAGNLEESRANEAEKAGRAGASEAWAKVMAETDPQKRTAAALALAENPWLSQGAQGAIGAMAQSEFRPPTDDQREYKAAQEGGFQGSFMDYMKALKTPVMQAPPGYVMAPDSTPGAPRVVRMEGLPADPAAAPKPAVQNAEDEDVQAIQTTKSINAQLGAVTDMINSGKLDLGCLNNLGAQAQNFAGMSTENSVNYATFKATLEKMRNDSLILNKGVQTEGDAVRAWNALIANINDPKVVLQRIQDIQKINERAAAQRLQSIGIRRQRNNMEAFDPAAVALPDAAPPPAGGPEQFAPTDAALPPPSTAPVVTMTPNAQAPAEAMPLPPNRTMLQEGKVYSTSRGPARYLGNGQFEPVF